MVSTEVVPDVKSPTCFKRTVKPNILSFFTHVIQNELKTGFFSYSYNEDGDFHILKRA